MGWNPIKWVTNAIGSVADGAGDLLGGFLQNSSNAKQAQLNRDFQAQQALKQMNFQQYMSSTSYQRAMKDMKKAGLNPLLAMSQGGASTPSGASGSGAQAHMENIVAPASAKALQVAQTKSQLALQGAQVANTQQSTINSVADTELKVANAKQLEAELPAVEAEANFRKKQADHDAKWVEKDTHGRRAGKIINSAKQLSDTINPLRMPRMR